MLYLSVSCTCTNKSKNRFLFCKSSDSVLTFGGFYFLFGFQAFQWLHPHGFNFRTLFRHVNAKILDFVFPCNMCRPFGQIEILTRLSIFRINRFTILLPFLHLLPFLMYLCLKAFLRCYFAIVWRSITSLLNAGCN
jgi:hypothetical protein